ncbi:hypothetical protein [Scopulibacillus cellulosilyticus]|uniref:Hemolysin XhlA n=1 Tax=Scopulibacillus cellulosilyticus TaxID=2665665 RepID=A0ABW2Q1S5_9BACL
MLEEKKIDEIQKKLDDIEKHLKKIESRIDTSSDHRPIFGNNVWVLVPVACIVMWGLSQIF